MHKLLARQIRRHLPADAPLSPELTALLAAVDETYAGFDAERSLIEHAMRTVSDEMVARYQALAESQRMHDRNLARLAEAQRIAHVGSLQWDFESDLIDCSEEMLRILDLAHAESPIPGVVFRDCVHPEDYPRVAADMRLAMEDNREFAQEVRLRLDDDVVRIVHIRGKRYDADGQGYLVGTAQDVTERHVLETQLQQLQKMEAIGQLAGGIAHDFNNLLTVILGNVVMLLRDAQLGEMHRRELTTVLDASERAATLTRQLLSFSRKQIYRPTTVNVTSALTDLESIVRRLVPETIHIDFHMDAAPVRVTADMVQIEQAVLNLVVNARDAIHGSGAISVELAQVSLTANEVGELPAGDYAAISVRDNGEGIHPSILPHIFEPFYSTKADGEGTGLGLALVYGIAQRANGHVDAQSVVGQGSTFRLLIPMAATPANARTPVRLDAIPARPRRLGTILVVEDEATVRQSICRTLGRYGFQTIEARHGGDAYRLYTEHQGQIVLVLTDVMMPEMTGPELAARLRYQEPQLPILMMSGYTDALLKNGDLERDGIGFIEKPFTGDALVAVIDRMIMASSSAAA
jgi:two-component system, cell cycle sensor histidine kinase and response regulator CckA